MRWPWQRSEDDHQQSPTSTVLSSSLNPTTIGATLVLTTVALTSARLYRTRLRRIHTASHIPPTRLHEDLRTFPRGRSLFGVVLRVSDGDGVRLFHAPGGRLAGWGWARSIPSEPFPRQKRGTGGEKSWLSENTVNVRLSGIDAPELAHFGHPAQPGADDAKARLEELSLGRWARVYPHVADQYGRVVGTVFVKRWHIGGWTLLRKWVDVGAEVVRDGWATVYEGKVGVAFGGSRREDLLRGLEAAAKQKRMGIWKGGSGSAGTKKSKQHKEDTGVLSRAFGWLTGSKKPDEPFESPREFKARMKKQESAERGSK